MVKDISVSFAILPCSAQSYKQMCNKVKFLELVKVYIGSMIKILLVC